MQPSNKNLQCDPRRLRDYLDQQMSAAQESELETHLNECPTCRQQLNDWAVEPQWWTSATRYLKSDAWDKELAEDTTGAWGTIAARQERSPNKVLIRQLREWLDPTDNPKYLGRFGGYEIMGIVGHGGMGLVLKGFEPSLNRYVAIKVLAPALATNGSARRRFSREAQAAAAVLHENVIAIHRVADAHDLPYLVMPYINGMTLQKRIDVDGPMTLIAVLRISRQIAAGLAAAHAQGLVHRDVKPANILLEMGVERVTLTDFGLARAADDASLTRTGVIAGTPHYMSPEQARGDAIDARSDLFSLGSVMYAMCTGHSPFRAETSYGILRRISDSQPRSIREINPEIPDWFEAIVDRLHAKSPSDRLGSAEELAELLEACLGHVQQPARVPLPAAVRQLSNASKRARSRLGRRVREWRWRLLFLIVSALIGLFGLHAWQSVEPDSPEVRTGPRDADQRGQEASGLEDGGQEEGRQQAIDLMGELPWEDGIQDRIEQVGERLELLKRLEPELADQDPAADPTRAPAAADPLPPD